MTLESITRLARQSVDLRRDRRVRAPVGPSASRATFLTASAALVAYLGLLLFAAGVALASPENEAPATSALALLSPPKAGGPVVVRVHFALQDVNEINDGMETFEFAGVLTLEWKDPRQAFEAATVGLEEKIFQGTFQFDELSTGWYPQVVLLNEAGLYQHSGVVLRVRPDGTSTLITTLNATAESEFDMSRFPFDEHRLEAVFGVLGMDRDEVLLQVTSGGASSPAGEVRVPQWRIRGISASVEDRPASYGTGGRGVTSAFVMRVDVLRKPFYAVRLIIVPLAVIVLLSFSVFWMDRSSLGDRLSVSFIGILTSVAYQLVMAEQLPRIAYLTFIHGFLTASFLTMCGTVVVNLVVGELDSRGQKALGDRIDRSCRWIFPLFYFGLMLVIYGTALWFF